MFVIFHRVEAVQSDEYPFVIREEHGLWLDGFDCDAAKHRVDDVVAAIPPDDIGTASLQLRDGSEAVDNEVALHLLHCLCCPCVSSFERAAVQLDVEGQADGLPSAGPTEGEAFEGDVGQLSVVLLNEAIVFSICLEDEVNGLAYA